MVKSWKLAAWGQINKILVIIVRNTVWIWWIVWILNADLLPVSLLNADCKRKILFCLMQGDGSN